MNLREFMAVSKALADGNRVRMLLALRRHELCVCQITELLGLALSTTSKHLSILYRAGLLNSRKDGRWIYYSLPGKEAPTSARQAIRWAVHALTRDPRIAADAARLAKVIALDPIELCRRLCRP